MVSLRDITDAGGVEVNPPVCLVSRWFPNVACTLFSLKPVLAHRVLLYSCLWSDQWYLHHRSWAACQYYHDRSILWFLRQLIVPKSSYHSLTAHYYFSYPLDGLVVECKFGIIRITRRSCDILWTRSLLSSVVAPCSIHSFGQRSSSTPFTHWALHTAIVG